MLQVLSLIKPYGHELVGAVRHLVEAVDLTHAREAFIELDALSRFERPLLVMTDYDGLLDQEVTP
jgi:hypothetical protein